MKKLMISFKNSFFRGFIYLFSLTFIAYATMKVFISSLSLTTLSTSVNPYLSSYINMTLPENFGFFTKNPKDERIKIFKNNENSIEEIDLRANTNLNLFGLKRTNRRITYELGILIRKVPDSVWFDLKSSKILSLKLNDSIPFKISSTKSKIIKIDKGDYIIYFYNPIPWELNKYQKETNGKIAYIKIE